MHWAGRGRGIQAPGRSADPAAAPFLRLLCLGFLPRSVSDALLPRAGGVNAALSLPLKSSGLLLPPCFVHADTGSVPACSPAAFCLRGASAAPKRLCHASTTCG